MKFIWFSNGFYKSYITPIQQKIVHTTVVNQTHILNLILLDVTRNTSSERPLFGIWLMLKQIEWPASSQLHKKQLLSVGVEVNGTKSQVYCNQHLCVLLILNTCFLFIILMFFLNAEIRLLAVGTVRTGQESTKWY